MGNETNILVSGTIKRDAARDQSAITPKRKIMLAAHMAASRANDSILTHLRNITENQLEQLARASQQGVFSAKEASTLLKVAQVYSIMDAGVKREIQSMDFSDIDDTQMQALEAHAARVLGTGNDSDK